MNSVIVKISCVAVCNTALIAHHVCGPSCCLSKRTQKDLSSHFVPSFSFAGNMKNDKNW